jgi:lactoylglutathione lyase
VISVYVYPHSVERGSEAVKLSQIRLMTSDFHKSVAFYRDVMELPLGTYAEGMQFASFNTGETKIEIFSRQVDEVCAGLKNKGVLFLNEPHDRKDWNARVAHLRDPDGNVIELYKHPL